MTLENIHSDGRTHLDLFENASDGYRPLQTGIKQSKMITVLNPPQINVWYESESVPKLVSVSTGPNTHFLLCEYARKTPLWIHPLWCNLLARNVNLSVSHLSQWWILLFRYFKPLSFIKVWHLFHRMFFCIRTPRVNTEKIKPLKWMTFQYAEPMVAKKEM